MEQINISQYIEDIKSKNTNIKNYIESLNPMEYKALAIALKELESSFSIEKSIGFINYMKDYSTP